MKLGSRHLVIGLCLSLVGASPVSQAGAPGEGLTPKEFARAVPALAVGKDGRLSLDAAGRRFEFGQGQVAVSAGDSSWTYRFQGSQGGIRALSISTLPEQTAPGSLEYTHSQGILERYVVKSRGVEQQFVLPGPYAGGDILLTGSVETELVPEVTSSFEGIGFRRDDATILFYGEAKAVDAVGKAALLEERWADGELTIVVPAAFLAAAQFPVLVDPLIGTRVTVDSAVDLAQNPAVASTGPTLVGGSLAALAVWSTNATSPQSIRGRIIGPRGNTIVGGALAVVNEFSAAGTTFTKPRVAWSSSDSVWVVAAEGHASGVANPNFIQVNKVATTGTKTTGINLNASVGTPNLEQEPDVACNNSGQCLIAWALDSDNSGTPDSIKGVFYVPGTNTFGSIFNIILDTASQRSHPRITSNGTDYYVVLRRGTNNIDGYFVTSTGTVASVNPGGTTTTTTKANPDVAFNSQLGKYLVVWEAGLSIGPYVYGSTLSSATPPVPSIFDEQLVPFGFGPQLTSQQFMGWSMVYSENPGRTAFVDHIRADLTNGGGFFVADADGLVPGADVAHFDRGLSVVVYEDEKGSATDHDIRAQEFLIPATAYADFNNNGFASAFVWRPGTDAHFYFNNDLSDASVTSVQFGTTGDIPVRLDFDGDGLPDLAVFRPSDGTWYIDTNRDGIVDLSIQFGTNGDIPVPGDYDGDGRTDLAVFRPSIGTWFIRDSATASTKSVQFGTNGDVPVPADYGGINRTDIAVWRPSTGEWFVSAGNSSVLFHAQFGTAGDIPVPGDYGPSTNGSNSPDGKADFAVFRPSTGTWFVSRNRDGAVSLAVQFGTNGDIPVGGLYDNNPAVNSPFAVFRPSTGTWFVDRDNNGTVDLTKQFGTSGDIPMQQPSGQFRN